MDIPIVFYIVFNKKTKQKDIIKDIMPRKKDIQSPTTSKGTQLTEWRSPSILFVFGKNHSLAYIYKKTEKLVAAIHLVTNFVPENEPARQALRDKSVCTLSDMLVLRTGFTSSDSLTVDKVIASLCEITSLLDVLAVAGSISRMNHEVIRNEIESVMVFLQETPDTESVGKTALTEDDFIMDDEYKGQSIKDNIKDNKMSHTTQRTYRTQQSSTGSRNSTSTKRRTNGERREKILSVIKDKKNVSVKDISQVVTDCSEKTLQRELLALVAQGVLKKEGERRWSTYSLA